MQQVKGVNVDSLPRTGYYVSKDERRNEYYKTESHICKQGPLRGVKAGFQKLTDDIFTYFPKGFAGSKNSDFDEYLSMGLFASILGSFTLAALVFANNREYTGLDKTMADRTAMRATVGVILYALGKWASPKLSRTLINLSTGVDLDMKYINKNVELPEPGHDKGIVRSSYKDVYASKDFYRSDLLTKDGELNHDNMYYHDDRIAQKAGYPPGQNASNQIAGEKIRGVKTRATAMESISKYLTAALGVSVAFVSRFPKMHRLSAKGILKSIKDGFVTLWKGKKRNLFTQHAGKALVVGSIVSTLLAWLVPTIAFKKNPETMKSNIDSNREYEVG